MRRVESQVTQSHNKVGLHSFQGEYWSPSQYSGESSPTRGLGAIMRGAFSLGIECWRRLRTSI